MSRRAGRPVALAAMLGRRWQGADRRGSRFAARGRGRERRARRGSRPAPRRRRRRRCGWPAIGNFDAPVYVARRPGRRRAALRGRAAGDDQGDARRAQTLAQPFLDIARPGQVRRRAGAALGRLRPRYAQEPALLRLLHRTATATSEVDEFKRSATSPTRAEPGSRAQGDRDPAPAVRQPQRRPAPVRARRACSTSAPATAAARGDPHDNAQNPNALLGKLLRIDPQAKGRGYTDARRQPVRRASAGATRSSRSGCATRSASPSTARPGDIAIGDVGQDAWEEIDYERSRERRAAPTSAGTRSRATTTSRADKPPARPPASRRSSTRDAAAPARSPAATSSATRELPALPAATSTPTSATAICARSTPGRPGPTDRPRACTIQEPTSFGADGRRPASTSPRLPARCRGSSRAERRAGTPVPVAGMVCPSTRSPTERTFEMESATQPEATAEPPRTGRRTASPRPPRPSTSTGPPTAPCSRPLPVASPDDVAAAAAARCAGPARLGGDRLRRAAALARAAARLDPRQPGPARRPDAGGDRQGPRRRRRSRPSTASTRSTSGSTRGRSSWPTRRLAPQPAAEVQAGEVVYRPVRRRRLHQPLELPGDPLARRRDPRADGRQRGADQAAPSSRR